MSQQAAGAQLAAPTEFATRAPAQDGRRRARRPRSREPAAPVAALMSASERLLSMKTVTEVTSYSRTSINRLIEQGEFPVPIKLGPQKIAFKESEIRAWIDSRRRRVSAHAGVAR
jgi:prophage regulatory protein